MSAHRLLYLTPHQLLAFNWQAGHFLAEGEFAVESAGGAFADYLRKNGKSLFSIVTNLAEEGFQLDTIPFLGAGDRDVMIRRKLSQNFQGTALALAMPLGHEKTTRKNERILLAALTNAGAIEPWLSAIGSAEVRLTGIFSLPLLSQALLEKLRIPRERAVLITLQDNTVRQSFFDNGHLHFSRVTPVSNSSISGLAQTIGSEIKKLQQYLLSQRMINRGEVISAHVIVHPQAQQAIAALSPPESVHLETHSIVDLAKQIGMRSIPEDNRAQLVFLQIAATRPPKEQFAPAALLKEYRLWQISRGFLAAGAVALFGAVLFAGKVWMGMQGTLTEKQRLEAEAGVGEKRYSDIVSAFPKLPLNQDSLRQVINRFNEIQAQDRRPEAMLKYLSAALLEAPQIELSTLDWSAAGSGGAADKAPSVADRGEAESLRIDGTVHLGPTGTPRQLLAVFEGFVQKLRVDAAYSVSIIKQPFDTGSESALKSGEGADAATRPKPFSLTLSKRSSP